MSVKKLTAREETHFFLLKKLKASHFKKAAAEAEIRIIEIAIKNLDLEQN